MANVVTQIVTDNGTKAVVKVVVQYGAANTSNTVFLQANTLFGANASKAWCPTIITNIAYFIRSAGIVNLEWVGSTNGSIAVFTGNNSGQLSGLMAINNAVAPTGDLNLNQAGMVNGDAYNLIITLEKDSSRYGNTAGAWANTNKGFLTDGTGA